MSTALAKPQRVTRPLRRDILEYADSGTVHPIDRGRGLIHDVKILGARSRNGGVYAASAMAAARPLYEGTRVNIDHPDRSNPEQERAFEDWFGVLENVRQTADGLYGDLAYLTTHPLAAQICEAAERFPGSFGLSHNAQVTESAQEGQVVYEAIHRVRSVDIVCKPATTRGIFESEDIDTAAASDSAPDDDGATDATNDTEVDDEQLDAMTWSDFIAQMQNLYEKQPASPDRVRQAIELVCTLFGGDVESDSPSDAETDDDPAAGEPVIEQTHADSASNAQALSQKLAGGDSTSTNVNDRSGNALNRARNVLEATGLSADNARIAAWLTATNEEARRGLLASWLSQSGSAEQGGRPRSSSANALESAAPTAKPAADWSDPRVAALMLLGR